MELGKNLKSVWTAVADCRHCAARFAATATAHAPRPVLRVAGRAPILIAGQAPGMRVHKSGLPFDDPSGERLRDWLGVDRETFYDLDCFDIAPMAFCFPGYNDKGADLPPPPDCARLWRQPLMDALDKVRLTLVIGGAAQNWHFEGRMSVTARVAGWRDHFPAAIPLPHPSWRNTAWLKKHPWFEAELVPVLRRRVKEELDAL
ncbi:uracil-DNA glycosylase family protein [Paracoccaceae bacterium GXU_MW_L88]